MFGKIIYATVFCIALPIGLVFWAQATSAYLPPPPFENTRAGTVLLVAGIALMGASMLALHIHGRGLPMNGYPPPVYVTRGPYRLMRHPIYVGFCVACAGTAIMYQSGGGFWLVLPTVIAGCAALVWGFERPDLLRRFGPLPDQHEPFFRIPKTPRILIRLLRACVRIAERLANSLRTRRIGPLRVFNHAIYSGSAAFVGILIAGIFTGTRGLCAVSITGVCTLVGGALWAQFVEGSPTLLRPFGYYGAILGGVIGALLAPLTGADTLVLLAAFATASPVIVAIGRLRCLVQGCCHGRPLDPGMDAALGLRVTNPSSRVCLMSPFRDTPIHPTPLYAIAAHLVIALILLCLWNLGARLTLLLGLYFLLAGLARFVEEAYRGESQTRVWKRLTEYQWYAVGFVVIGATVTALPCAATPPPAVFTGYTVAVAVALGLLTAFAMSMDFPNSSRRFSRLTG